MARWQAEWVAERLTELGHEIELVPITTAGDQSTTPLAQGGGVGVFTKRIQTRLLDGSIDFAVHSLKDLPTANVDGLTLAAIPERAPVQDVLVGSSLESLAPNARVGTGSMRRRAQLLHHRGDLVVADIRGNVDTRLAKLDAGDYDAIVLAKAGLVRLGLSDRITEELSVQTMLPAVGQGALGIEARQDDEGTTEVLRSLNHPDSEMAVKAERRCLFTLQAGCLAPVGAYAQVHGGTLTLDVVVVSIDGAKRLAASVEGDVSDAVQLGEQAADSLLAEGAAPLIDSARSL